MAARPTSAAMTSRTRTTTQPQPQPRPRSGRGSRVPAGDGAGGALGQEPGRAGRLRGGGAGARRGGQGGRRWARRRAGGGAGWYTGAGRDRRGAGCTGGGAGDGRGCDGFCCRFGRSRRAASRTETGVRGHRRAASIAIPDRHRGTGSKEVSGRTTPMIRRRRTPFYPRSTPYRRTSVRNRCSRVAAGRRSAPCGRRGLDDRGRGRHQPVKPLRRREHGDRPGRRDPLRDPDDGRKVVTNDLRVAVGPHRRQQPLVQLRAGARGTGGPGTSARSRR